MLVCRGLAERMNMPISGKRSALGTLWGPMNDPNLNGTHPALLAALRCNSDVQLPYRFPVNEITHDEARCDQSCHLLQTTDDIVREAQRTQAAQAGYACDYQNKRHPIAMHEVKEWQKGHWGPTAGSAGQAHWLRRCTHSQACAHGLVWQECREEPLRA